MPAMPLRELFDKHYRPLQIPQATVECCKQYRQNIAKADGAIGRVATTDDLTDDLLSRVCGKLLADGRSPATANKVRAQLIALWNFAARRGMTNVWPTLRKYKEYRREPTAWTREQLVSLFNAARLMRGKVGEVDASLWWLALLSLLWDTGLRIGAAMKIEWSQIDFERGCVLVLAEQQKHREDQWFRLHPHTLMLFRLMRREQGRVFTWHRARNLLWQSFGSLLTKAGLPNTRRDKFHRMRRSVATHFEAAGGNATELLGHSCREVTRLYLDSTITGKQHAVDLLFRPEPPPDQAA